MLPPPADPAEREDVLWRELESSFGWYDRQAGRNRLGYQILKVLAVAVGALVTVLAASDAPPVVTALGAAVVVVAEGVQQVFQFHSNWISYRTTAEALRQHALQYAAEVGPYADRDTRRDVLATSLQTLVSTETTGWASTMRRSPARGAQA